MTSTETLVRRAQQGDDAAFDELVERFRDRLATWIRPRLGARQSSNIELDDVLQETFVRVYRSIGRFRWEGDAAFEGWLRTIAKHLFLKAAAPADRPSVLRLEREIAVDATSPSRALRRDERFDRLERALHSLSPDHRQVIRLARIDGMPIREIAQHTGRSPDAVSQALSRALKKLRERFGDTESLGLPDRTFGPEGGSRENG